MKKRNSSIMTTRTSTSSAMLDMAATSWETDTIELDAVALERLVETLPLTITDQLEEGQHEREQEKEVGGSKEGEDNNHSNNNTTKNNRITLILNALEDATQQLEQHYVGQDHKLCNMKAAQDCPYCSKHRLNEIALALQEILKKIPSLQPHLVAEVHSMIGLLRQKQGNFEGACQSFLKVSWIQSSSTVPLWHQAMTKHRLAMAYGRSGQFEDACLLLEQALVDYHQADPELWSPALVQSATQSLANYQEASRLMTSLSTKNKESAVSLGQKSSLGNRSGSSLLSSSTRRRTSIGPNSSNNSLNHNNNMSMSSLGHASLRSSNNGSHASLRGSHHGSSSNLSMFSNMRRNGNSNSISNFLARATKSATHSSNKRNYIDSKTRPRRHKSTPHASSASNTLHAAFPTTLKPDNTSSGTATISNTCSIPRNNTSLSDIRSLLQQAKQRSASGGNFLVNMDTQ